jgi:leucyl-tRNA synthetase
MQGMCHPVGTEKEMAKETHYNPKIQKKAWGAYQPQSIEPKWQLNWEKQELYKAQPTFETPKYYCLEFFPYPSGEGLHVGHCRNYIPTDVISRFMRMRGYNVLHPMGWDAFGEPAEQYAIAHGVHPRISTDRNTANFRRQMTLIGAGYDWSREIDSSDPDYYRWTQWIFLLLYKRGLAYRDTNWQWWCPTCQTTLSSHEAAGGVCWRGHSGVTKREIPAWYFNITSYADELLYSLEKIDWPEKIKTMQRNWIGRSEGYQIDFVIDVPGASEQNQHKITVFTTRPDTLFGATFFLLAPEHPDVDRLTVDQQREQVETYRQHARGQSEIERMMENRGKTGVFTGGYVLNPMNGERLPVWVVDYVMMGYGTGAVMGVPAHDQRDFELAQKYGFPIRRVISPQRGEQDASQLNDDPYLGDGYLLDSGSYSGLSNKEAIQRIGEYVEQKGIGRSQVNYRMRDWLISRQRYWGAPIPIVFCESCGTVPVPEEQLPVLLPDMTDFKPDGSGRSPLARVPEFVNTDCPICKQPAKRETDTMGGFACSSWYFLRFASPDYADGPFDLEKVKYWLPVDLYVGGAEHAVLHLLYARFWTKVLADAALLSFREPFPRLLSQGQMMGPDGQRMSKSRGNVVTPDHMVSQYGSDALRVYTLFMAPFDQDVDWNTDGITGAQRFLNRIWDLYAETYSLTGKSKGKDPGLERELHKIIRQVTERIEGFRFNTMVSAFMEFTNLLISRQKANQCQTATFHHALDTLLMLMAPMAPHITEELWQKTGHVGSIHQAQWVNWDPDLALDEKIQIAVQVNGRTRGVIEVDTDIQESEVLQIALEQPKVTQFIGTNPIKQVIFVPGKILNIVTQH